MNESHLVIFWPREQQNDNQEKRQMTKSMADCIKMNDDSLGDDKWPMEIDRWTALEIKTKELTSGSIHYSSWIIHRL